MKPEAEALICAKACEAIYGSEADEDGMRFCTLEMKRIGFDQLLWNNFETPLQDICAFAATSDQYHILAFRGTKLAQDWVTDLGCIKIGFEDIFPGTPAMGEIHAGFGRCLTLALDKIQRMLIHRDMSKPLLVTGHSLGGGLAALAAVHFVLTRATVKLPQVRRVYTFGQPRVGVQKFCATYAHFVPNKLIRFVNNRDLVPRVPLRCQMFAEVGTMIHFDSAGTPKIESQEWNDFLGKPFGTIEEILGTMINGKQGVADHSMHGYRELVEKSQAALADMLPKN
jgi:triacylglycerol lipase